MKETCLLIFHFECSSNEVLDQGWYYILEGLLTKCSLHMITLLFQSTSTFWYDMSSVLRWILSFEFRDEMRRVLVLFLPGSVFPLQYIFDIFSGCYPKCII